MFTYLLMATFIASLLVSGLTVSLFLVPIRHILGLHLTAEATSLWTRSLFLTVLVVGASAGTRLWVLQRYMSPDAQITANVISMEVYRTVLATGEANIAIVLVFCIGVGTLAMMKPKKSPETAADVS